LLLLLRAQERVFPLSRSLFLFIYLCKQDNVRVTVMNE
jgi:hypothetical protein